MGKVRGQSKVADRLPAQSERRTIAFDLEVQPLDKALEAFGAATGQSVIYNSRLTEGRTSQPVKGNYTAQEALEALIGDTGLVARYTAQDAVVLVKKAAAPSDLDRPQRPQGLQRYRALLQAKVRDAFCGNALLAVGDRRVAFRFWVDAQGAIERAELLDSTGDRSVDAAVVDALRSVAMDEAPPAGLAQPFTMLVMPRSSGQSWNCAEPSVATSGSTQP